MDADWNHSWFALRAAQFPCTAEIANELAQLRFRSHFVPSNRAPFQMARGR